MEPEETEQFLWDLMWGINIVYPDRTHNKGGVHYSIHKVHGELMDKY